MEPLDELHAWTTLYLQWLDNEISKLKKTVALFDLPEVIPDERR